MKKIFSLVFFLSFFLVLPAQDINVPAQFPGGDSAWTQYLATNLNNQNILKQTNQKDLERFGHSQRVVYTFGIMTDGSIGIINIEGQVSQGVRNEIQRVLKSSPRWTPATVNGKPVVYRKKQVSTFNFD
jgi:protein TonB